MFLWVKAFHIISVVAWMAGLFYLPRLFVYHEMTPAGGASSELFKIMERRLARAIMLPAAVSSWIFGVLSMWLAGYLAAMAWWLMLKLSLVVGLSVFHVVLEIHRAEFAADLRGRGQRYYRVLNEVPTAILVAVVILVVVRPF